MTTRPTTGVRRIDTLSEGGWIAALYGPTDLDDLALQLHALLDVEHDDHPGRWIESEARHGRDIARIEDLLAQADEPTTITHVSNYGEDRGQLDVGWFRKAPCHSNSCWEGGGHAWHLSPAKGPGPGAFLGVTTWN